jgi:hypothetical protein
LIVSAQATLVVTLLAEIVDAMILLAPICAKDEIYPREPRPVVVDVS